MSRRRRALLITAGLIAFLVISVALARVLSANGGERSAVTDLVKAEAAGDGKAVLGALHDCDSACATRVLAIVRRISRPGRVQLLQYDPGTQVGVTTRTGTGRIAWRIGSGLPIVQCVRVRRGGIASRHMITLLRLTAPIGRESNCPHVVG